MGGRRGYGPTHSQSLERHFIGTPGLSVVAINNLMEPISVYERIFSTNSGPTLVIENKISYATELRSSLVKGYDIYISGSRYPTAWVKPQTNKIDITLIGYGGISDILVTAAEKLFEENDIIAQVICPTQIYPFDVTPIIPIILNAEQLLIVEEGQGFAGFASEIITQLIEQVPEFSTRIHRISAPADIIPASGKMEKTMIPTLDDIINFASKNCK
jgi:2-oxoisovalerate dehydrogenase E1 component